MDKKKKHGGRCKFGFCWVDGKRVPHEKQMLVVKRILEMRDAGHTLRSIQADEKVHHIDGRKFSVSTIRLIIGNRKVYEDYG